MKLDDDYDAINDSDDDLVFNEAKSEEEGFEFLETREEAEHNRRMQAIRDTCERGPLAVRALDGSCKFTKRGRTLGFFGWRNEKTPEDVSVDKLKEVAVNTFRR